jgi:TRAP-type C4-dicarboxylate transport system permease small subunit
MLIALTDRISRLFSLLMVICLAAMVTMVFGNVVLRYGFNSGITASEELSRWLFVWMTFLGAFVALRGRKHLGTNVLISRLPLPGRRVCFGLSRLLMLAVSCLIAKGGWQQTLINVETTSAVMQASTALLYVNAVVFGVLAAVVLLHDLWQLFTGQIPPAELAGVAESENMPHGLSDRGA